MVIETGATKKKRKNMKGSERSGQVNNNIEVNNIKSSDERASLISTTGNSTDTFDNETEVPRISEKKSRILKNIYSYKASSKNIQICIISTKSFQK